MCVAGAAGPNEVPTLCPLLLGSTGHNVVDNLHCCYIIILYAVKKLHERAVTIQNFTISIFSVYVPNVFQTSN